EFRGGGLDRPDEGFLVADVGHPVGGLAAGAFNLCHHLLQRLFAATADHHGGALGCHLDGRGGTDTRTTAGDEGNLVLHTCCHVLAPQMNAEPPLTVMFWPVMKPASSLAMKATTRATSSGWHRWPSGMAAIIACIHSSGMPAIIGVSVGPGTMVLTRIFCGASSRARLRVRPITPALEAT